MDVVDQIKQAVINGKVDADSQYPPGSEGEPGVRELVQEALDSGKDVDVVLNQGLIEAMKIVGDKFDKHEYFVPEMLLSAEAMKAGMKLLEPHLSSAQQEQKGVVIIGTVKGDIHDIGKNLVSIMLEGAGFKVIDLGTDNSADEFLEQAREHPSAIVGLSALLTTTMQYMREVIQSLRENGMENKVLIGGAPVHQAFAEEIQADGYSKNATGAVSKVSELLGVRA